jgi:hypothetical protein
MDDDFGAYLFYSALTLLAAVLLGLLSRRPAAAA